MNGRQTGFTYIALLIGVAIMGATLAAVGQVWQTLVQRDREKELLFVGNQFRQAISRYYASNRRYPLNLDDLLLDNTKAGVKRYLRKIFIDPMTGQPEWGTLKVANGQIIGVYSLSEDAPLKKAGFRQADTEFESKDKYSEWVFMVAMRGTPNPAQNNAPTKNSTWQITPANNSRAFGK